MRRRSQPPLIQAQGKGSRAVPGGLLPPPGPAEPMRGFILGGPRVVLGLQEGLPPVLEHSQNKANPADCVIRRRGSIEWGLDPVPSPAVRRLCDPRRVTILAGLEFLSVDPVTSPDCCG